MIRKKLKTGLLSAALAASVLLAGGYAMPVHAEGVVVGSTTSSPGWMNAGLISKNDLSVTTNAVGISEITIPGDWRIGTNNAYYVTNLWGSETAWSGDYRKLSEDEWDAFRTAVSSGNFTRDSEDGSDTLTGVTAAGMFIGSSQYRSSELTVVDKNTTTALPGQFDFGNGDKAPTYYSLYARKSNDEWDTIFEYDNNKNDITISWNEYLKDDYVYFLLYSTETLSDANTVVYRLFTTEDKLDAVRALFPDWTFSAISDGSEEMVDNGNGTFTVKDNDLGSTVINAAVVSEGMVYRMYNPNTGEHFYTKDASERDSLKESGWNYEENASFETIAADEVGATPVYRVYNPNSGLHHYTMEKGEALYLKSLGWNYEGISLYVYGKDSGLGTPEYRLYNENDGQHHWTVDAAERDALVALGWTDEGIAWRVK